MKKTRKEMKLGKHIDNANLTLHERMHSIHIRVDEMAKQARSGSSCETWFPPQKSFFQDGENTMSLSNKHAETHKRK